MELSNNVFNRTINEALKNLPKLDEWLSLDILNKFNNIFEMKQL